MRKFSRSWEIEEKKYPTKVGCPRAIKWLSYLFGHESRWWKEIHVLFVLHCVWRIRFGTENQHLFEAYAVSIMTFNAGRQSPLALARFSLADKLFIRKRKLRSKDANCARRHRRDEGNWLVGSRLICDSLRRTFGYVDAINKNYAQRLRI